MGRCRGVERGRLLELRREEGEFGEQPKHCNSSGYDQPPDTVFLGDDPLICSVLALFHRIKPLVDGFQAFGGLGLEHP